MNTTLLMSTTITFQKSENFTLSLTVPDAGLAPRQPGRVRVTTDDELKRFAEIVELGVAGLPTADSTPSELDELASALVNLLTSAAKAVGRPTRKGARSCSLVDRRMRRCRGCISCNQKTLPSWLQRGSPNRQTRLPSRSPPSQKALLAESHRHLLRQ
ncbi:hypothetical protein FOMG_18953 [Fusarium oxysporum f. sp. melonis 26406]|uniref:Uncharacterized protein n=1 Tax=Fusarium oxysporum f. sp. melonis 26406 TaxID=1089452 RepID=W9ZT70_FUSOX|nr:hypothetical protein FOMG_18953 [Fusarium oxysporum f. sp. melonis 26406]